MTAATDTEAMADAEVAEAARLLVEVVLQDVDDTGTGPEIADGVAKDRIESQTDPEMRQGRKSASRRFDVDEPTSRSMRTPSWCRASR